MDLELATVEDATNIGCRVLLLDSSTTSDAGYATKLQEAGIVIRPGHVVVVDRRYSNNRQPG